MMKTTSKKTKMIALEVQTPRDNFKNFNVKLSKSRINDNCIVVNSENEDSPELSIMINNIIKFKGSFNDLNNIIVNGKKLKNMNGGLMAELMAEFVNTFNSDNKNFVESMAIQHRTLQQAFTGLCLNWFAYLATLNENQYDARNEYSVKVAKTIAEKIPDIKYGTPMI